MQYWVGLTIYLFVTIVACISLAFAQNHNRKVVSPTIRKTTLLVNVLLSTSILAELWTILCLVLDPANMNELLGILGVTLELLPGIFIFGTTLISVQILSLFGCLIDALPLSSSLGIKIDANFVISLQFCYIALFLFLTIPRFLFTLFISKIGGPATDNFGWFSYYLLVGYGVLATILDNIQSFFLAYCIFRFAKKKLEKAGSSKQKDKKDVVESMTGAVLVICILCLSDWAAFALQVAFGVNDPTLASTVSSSVCSLHMSGVVWALGSLKEVTYTVLGNGGNKGDAKAKKDPKTIVVDQ